MYFIYIGVKCNIFIYIGYKCKSCLNSFLLQTTQQIVLLCIVQACSISSLRIVWGNSHHINSFKVSKKIFWAVKNLILSSPASHQAYNGQEKEYQPSFPFHSSPLPSQSGMVLMTEKEKELEKELEKEQFLIYWINLFRNIMSSKDLLFLNPACSCVCVRFLLIFKRPSGGNGCNLWWEYKGKMIIHSLCVTCCHLEGLMPPHLQHGSVAKLWSSWYLRKGLKFAAQREMQTAIGRARQKQLPTWNRLKVIAKPAKD